MRDRAACGRNAGRFRVPFHTELGHRCRGARGRRNGSAEYAAKNGQTVEIMSAKTGGPTRDWLNAELGYLQSPRAKAKVRAWFNAQVQAQTIARGRELVERKCSG